MFPALCCVTPNPWNPLFVYGGCTFLYIHGRTGVMLDRLEQRGFQEVMDLEYCRLQSLDTFLQALAVLIAQK